MSLITSQLSVILSGYVTGFTPVPVRGKRLSASNICQDGAKLQSRGR